MNNIAKSTLVKAIAAAIAIAGLSACSGGGSVVPPSSVKATVNDSLVADANVTIQVVNDAGAKIDVSLSAGTSGVDGSVSVEFNRATLAAQKLTWPVYMVADKTLASGEKLHFETYLGSVAEVLNASADGSLDMATEGDHGEISNIGLAKMELIRSLVKAQLVAQSSTVTLDQIPSADLFNASLWDAVAADMSEATMLTSIAVKTVVDYDAKVDTTHVPDYNADGSRDTQELARKIAEDVVSGTARSLDYYVIPQAVAVYPTMADIMNALQTDVASNVNDPIFSYSTTYAGLGDFATNNMTVLLANQATYAEAKQQVSDLTCAGINVTEGNVYTVTLTYPDGSPVSFSYTAVLNDTPALVAAGLQAAIDADAAFTATVATDVVTVTVNEPGVAVDIAISVVDSTGVAITVATDVPGFTMGMSVMQDWTKPASITDYMTLFSSTLTTLETSLAAATTSP